MRFHRLMLIVGVDIGSVRRRGGFSWATADESASGQDDPTALGHLIIDELNRQGRVALAWECPLAVPVPEPEGEAWRDLGKARSGEGNRPWSAGAGAGSMATGFVQLAWLCAFVDSGCAQPPEVTTQSARFLEGHADLLLAEAMVTGDGKPKAVATLQDQADAAAAAKRLAELLALGSTEVSDVFCSPLHPLNLAAVAALHAGMRIDPAELGKDVLVAKARPV